MQQRSTVRPWPHASPCPPWQRAPLLCIPGSHYQMAWQQGGWVVDGWWMGGSSCVFPHTSPARATGIQPAERRGHAARDVNMDGHEGRGWDMDANGPVDRRPWKKAGTVGHPVRPHPQHPAHAVHSTTGFAMAQIQIAVIAARTARRCRVEALSASAPNTVLTRQRREQRD